MKPRYIPVLIKGFQSYNESTFLSNVSITNKTVQTHLTTDF